MATVFYILLVLFTPTPWSWFWFIISIIFSVAGEGTRIIYRYTTDKSLAGHEDEA